MNERPLAGRRRGRIAAAVLGPASAWGASAWYVLAALAMTWPLAWRIGEVVPLDLVDPLLNSYIIGWVDDHLLRALGGDPAALGVLWHANMFHPEPYALGYSEHLVAQAVQILPVYALTRDLVLCYNLLFLSTFVISGLGVYLLVRELTGDSRAALVAGLLFAFALYRAEQLGHLQVLSSQWMPFVFYGLRRFFERGRLASLAGAAAALTAQNLSCGYYLLYFPPFVAAYALYEMADRGLLRDRRTWIALAGAATAVALTTAPFLLPYLAVRRLGFDPRPLSEVDNYAADVYSYVTAYDGLGLWGALHQVWRKPEGALFPGVTPLALSALAVGVQMIRTWQTSASAPRSAGRLTALAARAAGSTAVATLAVAIVVLLSGRHIRALRDVWVPATKVTNLWPVLLAALACLWCASPRFRAWVRGAPRSAVLFFGLALALAFYLSLGRIVETYGYRASDETLYHLLYSYVPGFNGLRVPGRFAMLVSLFLAVLGGYGAAEIGRRGRAGRAAVLVAGLFFLAEARTTPFEVRRLEWAHGGSRPAAGAPVERGTPGIYRFVASLPGDAVVAELPFGRPEDEARYVFFSTLHWRRLVNGYSGGFPRSYQARQRVLGFPLDNPDTAWQSLLDDRVTAVVLHEWAFEGRAGGSVREWLLARGARPVATVGRDSLFLLPR